MFEEAGQSSGGELAQLALQAEVSASCTILNSSIMVPFVRAVRISCRDTSSRGAAGMAMLTLAAQRCPCLRRGRKHMDHDSGHS